MSVPKQCYKCSARVDTFVTWARQPVGWFCSEHDPRKFVGRTLRQMVEGSLKADAEGRFMIPGFWMKHGHAFREAAKQMLALKLAVIDETITIQLGPDDDPTLNRAQRRAINRRK